MEHLIKELLGQDMEWFTEEVIESIDFAVDDLEESAEISLIPYYRTVDYKRLSDRTESELKKMEDILNNSGWFEKNKALIEDEVGEEIVSLKFHINQCYSGDYMLEVEFKIAE